MNIDIERYYYKKSSMVLTLCAASTYSKHFNEWKAQGFASVGHVENSCFRSKS